MANKSGKIPTRTVAVTAKDETPLWLWEIDASDGADDGYSEHYFMISPNVGMASRQAFFMWGGDRDLIDLNVVRQGAAPLIVSAPPSVVQVDGNNERWRLKLAR